MVALSRVLVCSIVLTIGGMTTGFAATLRTVALTGDPAPGTNQNFGFFDPTSAVINNLGQVVFSHSGSTPVGVWSDRSGNLAPVLLRGDSTPGIEGDAFYKASEVKFNDAGQTSFSAVLNSASGTNIDSIWSEGPGPLTLMAHEGDSVPAPNEGSAFSGMGSFRLNQNGQTAIYTGLSGPGRDSGDRGIWLDTLGIRETIAVTGQQVPGLAQTTFASIDEPSLNSSGAVAFHALLDSHPDGSIWVGKNGELEMIVREDDMVPGLVPGRRFATTFGNGTPFNDPSINSSGDVAFSAVSNAIDNLFEAGFGIWAGSKGSLRLVAHNNGYATDPSKNLDFTDLHNPLLNANGSVAFRAEIGNETTGIWSEAFGGLAPVALEGQAVEGLDDFVFDNLFSQPPSGLAFNSEGRLAFAASLWNATTSESSVGLFAQDADGELQLIANTGGQLEVSPGNFQTIQELRFAGGAGDDDGRSSGFNNLGQVAFYASLSDGSTGIFVSNLVATLPDLPGDYNNNGTVDAADYTVWLDNLGAITNLPGDTTPGSVTQDDYEVWKANFGAILSVATAAPVPEPGSLFLLAIAMFGFLGSRKRIGNK